MYRYNFKKVDISSHNLKLIKLRQSEVTFKKQKHYKTKLNMNRPILMNTLMMKAVIHLNKQQPLNLGVMMLMNLSS